MAPDDTLDPGQCRACRGTGKVVSALGGESREVDCPWCEGSGRFIAEHDAQAQWGGEAEDPGDQAGAENAPAPDDAPLDA